MFLEPVTRQFPADFTEQHLGEQIQRDIDRVVGICKGKISETTVPHTIVGMVKIVPDNQEHLPQITQTYADAAELWNKENERNIGTGRYVPVFLYVQQTNIGINFLAGTYEPLTREHFENLKPLFESTAISEAPAEIKAPDLRLGDKTQVRFTSLINAEITKMGGAAEKMPKAQLIGNAIIDIFGKAVEGRADVTVIKTPGQLAMEILDYREGKTDVKPTAKCVDISLLVNELMKMESYDSAIINIHPIDRDGVELQHDGHTTAAVVADGWLIDPAILSETKRIQGMTMDKGSKTYANFNSKMMNLYGSSIGNPEGIEFHLDSSDKELEALFLLETGVIKPKNSEEYIGYVKAAHEANPDNFYANIQLGDYYSGRNRKEALKYYKQAVKVQPQLYLANYGAAAGLYNIGDREDAYGLAMKALKYGENFFNPHYLAALVSSAVDRFDDAIDIATRAETRFPEHQTTMREQKLSIAYDATLYAINKKDENAMQKNEARFEAFCKAYGMPDKCDGLRANIEEAKKDR